MVVPAGGWLRERERQLETRRHFRERMVGAVDPGTTRRLSVVLISLLFWTFVWVPW